MTSPFRKRLMVARVLLFLALALFVFGHFLPPGEREGNLIQIWRPAYTLAICLLNGAIIHWEVNNWVFLFVPLAGFTLLLPGLPWTAELLARSRSLRWIAFLILFCLTGIWVLGFTWDAYNRNSPAPPVLLSAAASALAGLLLLPHAQAGEARPPRWPLLLFASLCPLIPAGPRLHDAWVTHRLRKQLDEIEVAIRRFETVTGHFPARLDDLVFRPSEWPANVPWQPQFRSTGDSFPDYIILPTNHQAILASSAPGLDINGLPLHVITRDIAPK